MSVSRRAGALPGSDLLRVFWLWAAVPRKFPQFLRFLDIFGYVERRRIFLFFVPSCNNLFLKKKTRRADSARQILEKKIYLKFGNIFIKVTRDRRINDTRAQIKIISDLSIFFPGSLLTNRLIGAVRAPKFLELSPR